MIKKILPIILTVISSNALALTSAPTNALNHLELVRVILGLCLVLLIILVLSWLLKRLQAVHLGSSSGFQSVANMTLGPKERVVLVRAGGQYLLLGVASGAVSLLYDFGKQLPEGFNPEDKASFASILKSAVRKN